MKEGDVIQFTDVETGEILFCSVVHLHRYATFEQLYSRHDKRLLGYEEGEEATPDDMLAYYPKEEIEKYGVVGIEISL